MMLHIWPARANTAAIRSYEDFVAYHLERNLAEGLDVEILRLIGLEYPHWLRRLVG